ncbi:MAG: type II toxin-antitoxin system Phd/YefM family antitoxin [Microbacteriaceae bacterium]|nr:type II toxin-antitoxin system Phd/YefM family antitoxin [Microbacteriaceae bacterium]
METLPLAEARAKFSQIVDDVVRTHETYEVTRNGERAAVILSAEEYDGLLETLEILSDPEAMAEIREAEAAIARGETYSLEEVEAELRRLGRLR